MLLSEFMKAEGLSDSDVAEATGLSAEAIRKLRFRVRGASMRVAAKLDEISGGKVRAADLVPMKRRIASVPAEATP
jgi:hypothetical protein